MLHVFRSYNFVRLPSSILLLLQQLREMSQPPLVNTLNGDSENQDVENLIDGVCELITFFELVSGADSTSDSTFQALLSAVVKDSCLWVSHSIQLYICVC